MFKGVCGVCCFVLACALCSCGSYKRGFSPSAPSQPASLSSVDHVIVMLQENRSLDSYFGELRQYWRDNGYPDESFDGLPQFNPTSGPAPLRGPAPTNPGCDPTHPVPSDCVFDPTNKVTSFHFQTMCVENPSPSWNEAHVDWDYNDPVGNSAATLNGFVWSAAHDARVLKFHDINGIRAMGYYDGKDLNYYYYMATYFGTSDRWFQPVMSRTELNHDYLIAGTSQGTVYPAGTNANDTGLHSAKTIYQELQDAGITWKIYVDPDGSPCTGPPYSASCLIHLSYVQNFSYALTILANYPQNIAPISEYFTDVQNGTLPQVAFIEPASDAGLDEHPADTDTSLANVQKGASYTASLVGALMGSSSWKSSVFILTFDESGGFYDHVQPASAVSPDDLKPADLQPGDICSQTTGPTCDFTHTGYRVPLIVISPFTKQHYVSHTVADYTAILKFIETRFKLPSLTKRDAAQMDMLEFFNFSNPPYYAPPTPPTQNLSGPCYLDHLP